MDLRPNFAPRCICQRGASGGVKPFLHGRLYPVPDKPTESAGWFRRTGVVLFFMMVGLRG
jgi:hypothetical protein